MFVHVKYRNECGDGIVKFTNNNNNNSNQFITVNNVIEKARHTYGECSTLQLLNEHRRELNLQEIVKNARAYIVRRRSR